MQKIRCHPDPEDPHGPCLNCNSRRKPPKRTRISASSTAFVQALPCLRYRILDATLYRTQDKPTEGFSDRWQTLDLVDITEWADNEIKVIEITPIFGHFPYKAELRKVVPRPGEDESEPWTDRQGIIRTHYVPAYAIADIHKHARTFRAWIEGSVFHYIDGLVDKSNDLLWRTYREAFRHIGNAPDAKERALMGNAFVLWATCCCSCHPVRLIGSETLGIAEVDDPSSKSRFWQRVSGCSLAKPGVYAVANSRLHRTGQLG